MLCVVVSGEGLLRWYDMWLAGGGGVDSGVGFLVLSRRLDAFYFIFFIGKDLRVLVWLVRSHVITRYL